MTEISKEPKNEENDSEEFCIDEREEEEEESSNESEDKTEKQHEEQLNNPETFQNKRDFFSFYSKKRNSVSTTAENPGNLIQRKDLNSKTTIEQPGQKRFSAMEFRPRGFGISKIQEKVKIFEKRNLEKEHKENKLNDNQKKFYENNEPRIFNKSSLRVESIKDASINLKAESVKFKENDYVNNNKNNIKDNNNNSNNNNKNNNNIETNVPKRKNKEKKILKKLHLNLIVDYSKLINSSKTIKSIKKPKELDYFLNTKKVNKYNINTTNNIKSPQNEQKAELSLSFSSYKEREISTNFSPSLNPEKKLNMKHNRHKSDICDYQEVLTKISKFEDRKEVNPRLSKVIKAFQLYDSIKKVKKDKFILVKQHNNKITVEKNQKYKNENIKKILYESIPDNMALKRLDKAKNKLIKTNNNNVTKNQIYDILDKLVVDNNNNNYKTKKEKERQKLIRAKEIMPQLLLIKHKINLLMINNGNIDENKFINFDEKVIKTSVSSIYFLECIGVETNILIDDNENIQNIKFVNDVSENVQLNGINNRKKYLKTYFKNLNKANIFLEILIDNINKLQIDKNIEIND